MLANLAYEAEKAGWDGLFCLLTCSLFPKCRDFDLKKSNLGTLKGGLDELELSYVIHSES